MINKLLTAVLTLLKKEIFPLAILSVFVFLSARALFHDGFFRTIDDITTVRMMYLVKELTRFDFVNNFPVRLAGELSHRYGYPLYLFYAPLVYYAGALLVIFGKLSYIVASKWVYVFPLLVGPYLFYIMARQKFDRISALTSSILYSLFPFRGYDTYIRGGVGEAWVMAFLPGILLGLFMIEKGKKVGYLIFALFLFLSIISHNIGGLLVLFLAAIYIVFFLRKDFVSWIYLCLSLGMSAFLWLPSYYYLNLVKVFYSQQNTAEIFKFLVPFSALTNLDIPHSPESRTSGLFFYLLIFWLSIVTYFLIKKRLSFFKHKYLLFWGIVSLFLYFLLSIQSSFLWTITLPITRFVQFPWRVLVILSASVPIVVGFVILELRGKIKLLFILVVLFISLTFLTAFKPKEYSYYYEYIAEDSGPCATSWGDEYIPIWVKECPDKVPVEDVVAEKGKVVVSDNSINKIVGNYDGPGGKLIINRYYFPGWTVFIDGKQASLDYRFSKYGIFQTDIASGRHNILIKYTKTRIMWLADIISVVCGMLIFGVYRIIKIKEIR